MKYSIERLLAPLFMGTIAIVISGCGGNVVTGDPVEDSEVRTPAASLHLNCKQAWKFNELDNLNRGQGVFVIHCLPRIMLGFEESRISLHEKCKAAGVAFAAIDLDGSLSMGAWTADCESMQTSYPTVLLDQDDYMQFLRCSYYAGSYYPSALVIKNGRVVWFGNADAFGPDVMARINGDKEAFYDMTRQVHAISLFTKFKMSIKRKLENSDWESAFEDADKFIATLPADYKFLGNAIYSIILYSPGYTKMAQSPHNGRIFISVR